MAILGGGGAARSTAFEWAIHGGKVIAIEGRRPLPDGDWIDSNDYSGKIDIFINFDGGEIDEMEDVRTIQDVAEIVLEAPYSSMHGAAGQRLESMAKGPYNGRWLLVAQHLECWSNFWAPQLGDMLPSIGLLMTKLAYAEAVIEGYTK